MKTADMTIDKVLAKIAEADVFANALQAEADKMSAVKAEALLRREFQTRAGGRGTPEGVSLKFVAAPGQGTSDNWASLEIEVDCGRYELQAEDSGGKNVIANGFGVDSFNIAACGDAEAMRLAEAIVELGEQLRPLVVAHYHQRKFS